MSEREQRCAKSEPFNIRRGYSAGTLFANQDYAAIALGTLLLVGDGNYIKVDGENLLRLGINAFGELSVTATFEDQDGNILALIEDNEWVSGDPSIWDFTADHGRLKLWAASRQIALEIDARYQPITLRGELWRNGASLRIARKGLEIENAQLSTKLSHLGLVGMGLEIVTSTGAVNTVPYLGGGFMVSALENERLTKSWQAWNRLASPAFCK